MRKSINVGIEEIGWGIYRLEGYGEYVYNDNDPFRKSFGAMHDFQIIQSIAIVEIIRDEDDCPIEAWVLDPSEE